MQRPYYPSNKCSQGHNSLFRSSTNGLDQYLVTYYDLSAQTPTAAKLRCSTEHLSLGSGDKRDSGKGLETYVDADFAGGWDPERADDADTLYSRTGYLCNQVCRVPSILAEQTSN